MIKRISLLHKQKRNKCRVMFVGLLIYLFIFLSIYLSIYLFIYLSAHFFIYSFINLNFESMLKKST